jgi:hypothetical protein
MSRQTNFSFRFQPLRGSKNGRLACYLNEETPEMPRSERIIKPLACYWLPFAYLATGADVDEAQQIARSCIYQLQLHIQYLRDSFAIESAQVVSLKTGSVPVGRPNHLQDMLPEPEDGEEELDFAHEDEMLEAIC